MGRRLLAVGLAVVALGCGAPSSTESSSSDTSATGGVAETSTLGASASTAGASSSTGPDATATGDPDDTGSLTDGGSTAPTSSSSSGSPVACEAACNGSVHLCSDGLDNDGDGLVDLADPECLSPCHDDEETLYSGSPAGAVPCRRDCFIDANRGQGDDFCFGSLFCDPLAGADLGCPYEPERKVCQDPIEAQCIDFCVPSLPPGCDCFGCCEVQGERGVQAVQTTVFAEGCSLTNLAACEPCQPDPDCFKPCPPDACAQCFGQVALPPGCDAAVCPSGGAPCEVDADGTSSCGTCEHCLLGCCVPTTES